MLRTEITLRSHKNNLQNFSQRNRIGAQKLRKLEKKVTTSSVFNRLPFLAFRCILRNPICRTPCLCFFLFSEGHFWATKSVFVMSNYGAPESITILGSQFYFVACFMLSFTLRKGNSWWLLEYTTAEYSILSELSVKQLSRCQRLFNVSYRPNRSTKSLKYDPYHPSYPATVTNLFLGVVWDITACRYKTVDQYYHRQWRDCGLSPAGISTCCLTNFAIRKINWVSANSWEKYSRNAWLQAINWSRGWLSPN